MELAKLLWPSRSTSSPRSKPEWFHYHTESFDDFRSISVREAASPCASQMRFFPSPEAPTEIVGIDLQEVTDILKGKNPMAVLFRDPLFRVVE